MRILITILVLVCGLPAMAGDFVVPDASRTMWLPDKVQEAVLKRDAVELTVDKSTATNPRASLLVKIQIKDLKAMNIDSLGFALGMTRHQGIADEVSLYCYEIIDDVCTNFYVKADQPLK